MLPAAMQDSFFGGLVTACRATLGEKFTPLQVQFRHSEPACADRIEAFFRCPISYDGPDSSMLVSHDDIHAPLPTANVELALANDKIMQDYLARQDKANIVARVRLFVVQNLPLGVVSSADLARALEMSSRSLQRRLAESGTSYWQILDETRKEIAVERLLDKSTSVSEIAYMLGFAEAASLNRAFHRWTARTPSEFRAETV